MRRKKKTIECIEYLSVSAPLDKVDRLEDKQSTNAGIRLEITFAKTSHT